MAYLRVVPRDLFNEANLLKCYGRLWILLDRAGHDAKLDEGCGEAFDIQQDPASGQLTVANLPFTIRGESWNLVRPLNSRGEWPLYAERDDECLSVFDQGGNLSDEFSSLIYGSAGDQG